MKRKSGLAALFIALCFSLSAQRTQNAVLIELFSSEGCSSCPYADQFMDQLMNIADSTQSPVFVIDYHVDIWDHSGWKDPYSDTIWSDRQATYMKKVNQPSLFTPMLFVNGQYGMPAGGKKDVGMAINYHISRVPEVRLSAEAYQTSDHKGLSVRYNVTGKADSCNVMIALAHKELISTPQGGENKGQRLVHHNVVQKLVSVPFKAASGEYELALPPGTDLRKYCVTVFLQQQNSWKVLASDQLYFK